MINEFGEDTNSYCSFESKDTVLLQSENGNLHQRVNVLTHELQKRKEREEQLEDVIQAYEKIHMEKNNLQRDLDKMVRTPPRPIISQGISFKDLLHGRQCSSAELRPSSTPSPPWVPNCFHTKAYATTRIGSQGGRRT
ncbi:hypothetical protein AMECASPLE_024651 [Ameca splendens]|uniref:Uncharacterized protein n=1 Tax=Ameca splendens TaxID=208324 RepID=A0ABV1A104_9TELE